MSAGISNECNDVTRLDSWQDLAKRGDQQYGDGDLEKALQCYEKALASLDDSADDVDERRIQERIIDIEETLEEARRRAARTLVFVSYSHADQEYYDELAKYLNSLTKHKGIIWWGDTFIESGAYWRTEIEHALARVKVAILMVSIDFLDSEFIWDKEMRYYKDVAEPEGATILWIPVRPCNYEDTCIEKLQALIDPKRSLAEREKRWERDKVYTEVLIRIKKLFESQELDAIL